MPTVTVRLLSVGVGRDSRGIDEIAAAAACRCRRGARAERRGPVRRRRRLMSKSKLTPIRSKKLSLSVMKRTSMVTWRSCSRRNCSRRSTISSWTSCVWLTTRLRLVSKGRDRAGPADGVPGGGLDRRSDQVDEAVEVGLRAAAKSARPGARRRALRHPRPTAACGLVAIWASMLGLIVPLLRLAVAAGHHRHRRAGGRTERRCRRRTPRWPWRRGTRCAGPSARARSSESAPPGRPRCTLCVYTWPSRICSLVIFNTSSLTT